MTYETYEESPDLGLPASLFLFVYGSGPSNYYAYTDIDSPVVHGGKTYQPVAIGREKIEESGGLDNKTLSIDIDVHAEIVEYYKTEQPSQPVALTIMQGHVDDPSSEFVVVWSGRVIGIEHKPRFAKISADPVVTSMRRPGLRRHYQYGCPWALYSSECKASKAVASEVNTPLSVGGNFFEFQAGWNGTKTKSKFNGGYLQWTDDVSGALHTRTIISISSGTGANGGDVVLLNGSISGAVLTTNVTLYLGCNHGQNDCRDLHNNIVNFGGQPYIPKKNPIGFTNRYY